VRVISGICNFVYVCLCVCILKAIILVDIQCMAVALWGTDPEIKRSKGQGQCAAIVGMHVDVTALVCSLVLCWCASRPAVDCCQTGGKSRASSVHIFITCSSLTLDSLNLFTFRSEHEARFSWPTRTYLVGVWYVNMVATWLIYRKLTGLAWKINY